MATRLGDMAVGSTVKIKVNGTLRDFLIVQQGKPASSMYDASCNGTWVLMKDIYKNREWSSGNNLYDASDIHSYLNSTFLDLFQSNVKNEIKLAKIPYDISDLYANIFLLSSTEINYAATDRPSSDGYPLAYFLDCETKGSDPKRVAYLNGSAASWMLRSRFAANHRAIYKVTYNGGVNTDWYNSVSGVRPALILPSSLLAYGDDLVVGNQPPEITSDAGATGAELGAKNAPFTLSYTVTDGDGDPMRIVEKVNGVELAVRENVTTGTELTVQYLSEKALFQQILNGENTLTLEADDGKTTTEWTATFTKNVTGAVLSLTQPLTADDTITVAAMTLEGSFPADMSLTVELTNNGLDDSPAWENCTDIQRGESRAFAHHTFTNKTAVRGFAFNYKITVTRGESGTGGTLTMIGGVIG